MKSKIQEYWPYCVALLAVVLPLFLKTGYLFFTDTAWGPHIAYGWSSSVFLLGEVIRGLSFIFSVDLIEKFFITLCLGFVLCGGKKIAEQFIKERWLVFVASLFALFNPFIYDRAMYGQFGVVASFGLLFLGIGFLLEYVEKKQMRQILFAGIGFAFAVQFSSQFLFFISAFYIFVFLPILFVMKKNGIKTVLIEIVKISLLLAVIAFALNANWIIGSMIGKSTTIDFVANGITTQDLVAFQTSGKTGADALGNVLMMSGFWGKDQFRYADLTTFTNDWGRSFFLLLSLILWGFIAGIRSKEKKLKYLSIGSAFLFVISVILATGIRIPVGRELTYFLFNHFPLYKGLRESQKWVSVTVAIYLMFLSMGLRELFTTKIVERNAFIMKFFIGAVIVMQAPLLLFGFEGQVRPTQYPSDWYAANDAIVRDSGCSGAILFLPWHAYMGFSWIGHIVANPAPSFFQCPVISGTDMEWGGIYDNSQSIQGREFIEWFESKGKNDILLNDKTLGIKYIVLAKELDWQNYAWIDTLPKVTLFQDTATLKVYKIND